MKNIIKLLPRALVDPMPRKLSRFKHVQHVHCSSEQAVVETYRGRTGIVDVRRLAESRGLFYWLGALLVWFTPLRLAAAHAHKLRLRREALVVEQPFRNPFAHWIVTRGVKA